MLDILIFLNSHVVLNSPGRETISAGLGPIEQYGITLIVLIIVGIVVFIRRKKKLKR